MLAQVRRHDAPTHPYAPEKGYLSVPFTLLADLQDSPLAIGLWSLVGRLFFVAQAPVPLSAADVMAYDPTLHRGAVVRAFERLTRHGYLVTTERRGAKSAYTPAWGVIGGTPRAWTMGEAMLGRPRHRSVIRIDRRLLDTFLGRLTPHPRHPAGIRRYLTQPLLSLADVGAYALATVGHGVPTPALTAWNLARGKQVLPLPADSHILARASQLVLDAAPGPTLSDDGLRWLGIRENPSTEAQNDGQPLFYLPPERAANLIGDMIGSLIGNMIGQATYAEQPATAPECPKTPPEPERAIIPGNLPNQGNQGNTPPTPPRARSGGGGANTHFFKEKNDQPNVPQDTPTTQALRALHIRSAVIAELAEAPISVVEDAIKDGRTRPGIRDLAGWVVSLLRDARERGWTLPLQPKSPAPPLKEATSLPVDLQEITVECALAKAQSTALDKAPPVEPPAECQCGGSGVYLLDVPPGHPQHLKVQSCPCRLAGQIADHLTKVAGPELAQVDQTSLRVEERLYTPLTWAARSFTPAEQAATLRYSHHHAMYASLSEGRGVCLIGPPGSGKTTLAVAAAKAHALQRQLPLRFVSVPKLLDDLRREASDHSPATLLDRLIAAPVLVLDDLGREKLTSWTRERLYRLLEERLRANQPEDPRITIITSNLSFAELYAQDAALASRIAAHTEVLLCVASDHRLSPDRSTALTGERA